MHAFSTITAPNYQNVDAAIIVLCCVSLTARPGDPSCKLAMRDAASSSSYSFTIVSMTSMSNPSQLDTEGFPVNEAHYANRRPNYVRLWSE